MNILITGASGLIGLNLIEELSKSNDNNISVLIHRNNPDFNEKIKQFKGDLLDFESLDNACKGIDVIYHLAAYVSIKSKHDKKCDEINIDGTRNIVNAALKNQVKRFIHFSSISALNQAPFDTPVDENRPLNTQNGFPYSTSKAISEEIVLDACKNGLNAVIVNPTAVFGRNDYEPTYCGRMIKMLADGTLPAIVEGGFDWVDVRDVVNGAISAAEKGKTGERYILSGHYVTFKDLAEIIHNLGYTAPPKYTCSFELAWTVAPLVALYFKLKHQKPIYTRTAIDILRYNENVSSNKAETELGYHKHTIRETVKDTLQFFYETKLNETN